MSEELRSILVGTGGLTLAAGVAVVLTVSRREFVASPEQLRGAVRLVLAAVLVQTAHFAEELFTEFHQRFPELLGLAPWPVSFFLGFNLFWIGVWLFSALTFAAHPARALFPLWFLGIASLANGVAHPLLAIAAGGYFPGLFTSPLVGYAGVVLLRRLTLITDSETLHAAA
jgi:hypothetical protein